MQDKDVRKIIIEGAKEHNLKNLNLEIPRNNITVITGLSGSGKSSLAFDTIYAEGQRRYVESLSAYARQFLELMEKPDVERIEGLSPAISIEQKTTTKNPRSTVGTVTEIYDYLRLLYSRIGKPHCHICGKEIAAQTSTQITDRICEAEEGTKITIFSPIVRGKKGEYKKLLLDIKKQGFVRCRIDGTTYDLDDEIKIDKNKKHTIEVVIDRLVLKKSAKQRVADSVETALKLSGGLVTVVFDKSQEVTFSEKFACIECGTSLPELVPRVFSFNSPYGACEQCGGLGTILSIDPDLVVPDKKKTLREGAILPWHLKFRDFHQKTLSTLSKKLKFSLDIPFEKLLEKVRKKILYGASGVEIEFSYESKKNKYLFRKEFEGVIPRLENRYRSTESDKVREEIEQFMRIMKCPQCNGGRLKKEYLSVKIKGLNISQVTEKSIADAYKWFSELKLNKREEEISKRIIKEIKERLGFLISVGLDYLTLNRQAGTLSGGEAQRIRLATQIGSSLMGVLYILDEPSIGLHNRDHKKLLATLKRLKDMGNTVIIVEHDADTILSADYVVDLGPGAGLEGGYIVAQGTPAEIKKSEKSLTGAYLSSRISIPLPEPWKRRNGNGKVIKVIGASGNNLKNIDVKFPLGTFICVTGVSGSGKSTLVIETLYKALAKMFYRAKESPCKYEKIEGVEHIDKVINIDQSPIGRTPRSNPATYVGVFSDIRNLFSMVSESRMRGYKPGRFSFNVKGGRCDACDGDGVKKIEMHFLPDIYVTCEVCLGKRYNRETLDIRYKGKNIAEVLDMTVSEALNLFENIPAVKRKLETLNDVGLGYIKLGQSATTLSGGEAQRVKLAKELSRISTGKTLYILDEPTTGLHFDDIRKLLEILNRLTDNGNTVIVIEHNLDVIKSADYIIDLGPEGGDEGGNVVAFDRPEKIMMNSKSYTGIALKQYLSM
ncbi:MAG: excinuclease ABC subunit UvrA [Candidatus Schekmanbacteria bacterium]|nr:MAG: excinuclease ABC subunit UvrA [Candidatus Schekmanbacteria bacterium]